MASEVKQESNNMTRTARFDYVSILQTQMLPDKTFVMAAVSVNGFQNTKGYVRANLINSGFVVRAIPGQSKCRIVLRLEVHFPGESHYLFI